MKKISFLIIFAFSVCAVEAQQILQKFFDGMRTNAMVQSNDGGYLATGYAYYPQPIINVAALLKLDSMGNQQWAKFYFDSTYTTTFHKIKQLNNANIAIYFTSTRNGGVHGLMLTDSVGVIITSKTYHSFLPFFFNDILGNNDNSISLCGTLYYPGFPYPEQRSVLMKVDSALTPLWARNYKNRHIEYFSSMDATSDGGYVLQAFSDDTSLANQRRDILVFKTDSLGIPVWVQQCGNGTNPNGSANAYTGRIKVKQDGSIINGFSNNWYSQGLMNGILQSLDSNGNEIISRQFTGGAYNWITSFAIEPDGDIVVMCISGIYKTDSLLNLKWVNGIFNFISTIVDFQDGVFLTRNGGYVSYTNLTPATNRGPFYFFIADSTGNMFCYPYQPFTYFDATRNIPSINISSNIFDSVFVVTDSVLNF